MNSKTISDTLNYKSHTGLSHELVKEISHKKNEPQWMLDIRLKAFDIYINKNFPDWGTDLNGLDLSDLSFYVRPDSINNGTWESVPDKVKDTFEKLGIPQAEKEYLSGVKAQYDSEVVYGSLIGELKSKGVLFTSTDEAVRLYPELVKEYFGRLVPASDNKFAALNTALWSGGSFIYIPKGVKVEKPLQAYFRINASKMGQFERTLIIADEDSFATYVEGCSAPMYSDSSLHAAVVEVFVKDRARFRYTTIQNWYQNVYNLVTKRAIAYEGSTVEWVDANIGSRATMKYPCVILKGRGSKGDVLTMAFAGDGQHQDTGAKMIHLAPNTTSNITSKSISKGKGRASYRGLVRIGDKADNARANVACDALLIDENSRTDTYPFMDINNKSAKVTHEASVSKIEQSQLDYLMSRGISEKEALALIINGFIEPIVKQLPMEYALELNRLIDIEMDGSVG